MAVQYLYGIILDGIILELGGYVEKLFWSALKSYSWVLLWQQKYILGFQLFAVESMSFALDNAREMNRMCIVSIVHDENQGVTLSGNDLPPQM